MKKIWSDCIYYYGLCDVLKNTFRVSLQLVDKIDENSIRIALHMAQERYPYFSVKRVKTFKEILLDDNDLPWMLNEGSEPVTLASKESNYHLLTFGYKDDWLYVDAFHGLTDGNGIMNLIRTILYYYCIHFYDDKISPVNCKVVGDEITDEEIIDPYLKLIPRKIDSKQKGEKKVYMNLAEESGYVPTKPYVYKFSIPQEELMWYCGENDGSPATAIALFIARVINKIHGDSDKLIGCGIATNLRPALGVKNSHHSTISMPILDFTKKISQKDLELQGTAFRGQVLLKCSSDAMIDHLYANNQFHSMLNGIPIRIIKEKLMGSLVKLALKGPTFSVSYVGKCEFGECEKYVRQIYSEPDSPGTGIMVEINSVNDRFYITFIQEWQEKTYIDAFFEELADNSINCTLESEGPIAISDIMH